MWFLLQNRYKTMQNLLHKIKVKGTDDGGANDPVPEAGTLLPGRVSPEPKPATWGKRDQDNNGGWGSFEF